MLPKHFNTMLTILIIIMITAASAQWKKLISGTDVNLNGVMIIDSSSAIVIGDKGTILKTSDSGSSWQKINLGFTNNLNAISNKSLFISFNNLTTIAGDSIFLFSSNFGNTWSIKKVPYNFTTVDQGFTSPLLTPFSPDSSIILGTDDGRIVFSTDEGNTWQDTLIFNSKIIAVDFFFGTIPVGAGTGSRVSAASNSNYVNGDIIEKNWTKYNIGVYEPWQNITSGDLAYNYEFLAGDGGELVSVPLLLRKTQNDSTWTNISQNLQVGLFPNKIKNLGFALFICGMYGKIFKSTDNGNTWISLTTPTKTALNDIAFFNSEVGYAVGDSLTILFTSNGGTTSVDENSSGLPADFILYQNYPNPFNPDTKIKYNIPNEGKVELLIYNNLGQRIALLVDSYQSAGVHSVEFNSSGLVSGVYFYQLKFNNSTLIKKMLLLK